MSELRRLGVDRIVCLGDTVDPLPGSKRVLEDIIEKQIPMIRGNHEDYVIGAIDDPESPYAKAPNFAPVRIVGQSLEKKQIQFLRSCPLNYQFPDIEKVVFCHARPYQNTGNWRVVDEALAKDFTALGADVFVCGHLHDPHTTQWKDKTLIAVGSVGFPLNEKPEAEFAVIDCANGVSHQHLTVRYDAEKVVEEYVKSGWYKAGGPFVKLLMAELALQRRRVSPFFKWANQHRLPLVSEQDWNSSVEAHLREYGEWDLVQSKL